jgi:hypothetical protein
VVCQPESIPVSKKAVLLKASTRGGEKCEQMGGARACVRAAEEKKQHVTECKLGRGRSRAWRAVQTTECRGET